VWSGKGASKEAMELASIRIGEYHRKRQLGEVEDRGLYREGSWNAQNFSEAIHRRLAVTEPLSNR
jgi:hypothetical protein